MGAQSTCTLAFREMAGCERAIPAVGTALMMSCWKLRHPRSKPTTASPDTFFAGGSCKAAPDRRHWSIESWQRTEPRSWARKCTSAKSQVVIR